MDPILGRKLAEQNWVNATEKTSRNSKLINDAFKEFREKSQDFYFRLGITSGAILSLSVTFLGYLINSKLEFKFIEILLLGWLLLFITLLASFYRNLFYGNFGHFQIQKERIQDKIEETRAYIEFVIKYPDSFPELNSQEKIKNELRLAKENLKKYNKGIEFNKTREKIFGKLWIISQNSANIGFVLGVFLILLFVSFNIPIKYDLTLTN